MFFTVEIPLPISNGASSRKVMTYVDCDRIPTIEDIKSAIEGFRSNAPELHEICDSAKESLLRAEPTEVVAEKPRHNIGVVGTEFVVATEMFFVRINNHGNVS